MIKKHTSSIQLHGFEKALRIELSEYIQSYILPNGLVNHSATVDSTQNEFLHLIWFSEHLAFELKRSVKALKKPGFPTYIILIGEFEKMDHVITALRIGINGCISHRARHSDIIYAIKTVFQGKYYLCPFTLELLFSHFKKLPGENLIDYQLTPRELIIMRHLSEGKKYKEMGKQLFISENTVRSHIRHLYKKLEVHSKIEMISKFIMNNEANKKTLVGKIA